jgi:hypothetical protein
MSAPELEALIVEHLADLDRAAAGVDGIEARVFAAFGEKAGVWAKKHGWISDFDYPEGGWLDWAAWIAPPEWRTADTAVEDDTFDGRFAISVSGGDTESRKAGEDWFYLTRLCGAGVGQIGFRFRRTDFVKPKKWKQALPLLADLVKNTGFALDEEPSFFLPVTIQAITLAQAIREEDLEAALGPIDTALESLLHAQPALSEVLRSLRSSDS